MAPQAPHKFYVLVVTGVIATAIDKAAAIAEATLYVETHPTAVVTIAKAQHTVRRKPQPVVVEVVR
jgi:hypothetical protein